MDEEEKGYVVWIDRKTGIVEQVQPPCCRAFIRYVRKTGGGRLLAMDPVIDTKTGDMHQGRIRYTDERDGEQGDTSTDQARED